MTEFKRVFLDTAPIIYYLQRDEMYFEKMKAILIEFQKRKIELAGFIRRYDSGILCFSLQDWQSKAGGGF